MVIKAKAGLKKARIIAGLSMSGLAQKTRLNQATISYIESGKRNPSPATAKKICDVLKQPFENLFELKEE